MIDDATYEELRTRLAQDFNSYFAPATLGDTVSSIDGWRKKAMGDGSFGRIFNGPQWLDRVAIRDGAVNASKVAATFVIANTFTTADTTVTPTAARMEMTASGIKAYGTVSGIANTQTLSIANTGDFTFGSSGSNPITYVASTGTLTVPAAVIGSLTIANVGSGVLGGAYKTASGTGARLEFDTSGLRAYNSSNTKTFDAVASSGDLNLTGNLTVGSGGKINFGGAAADYLDNNILHFEVGSSEEAVVEIKNGSTTQYGTIYGLVTGSAAVSGLHSFGTSNRAGIAFAQAGTSDALTYVSLRTLDSTGAFGGGIDVQAAGGIDFLSGGVVSASFAVTNKALSLAGRLYPGTGSATQSSDYIDYGTTGVAGIRVNSNFVIPGFLHYTVTSGGTSGALPNPTKYITIADAFCNASA
jgi:hypothetical protein